MQPAVKFALVFKPTKAQFLTTPSVASALRTSLGTALSLPFETIYITGTSELVRGGSAIVPYTQGDTMNTVGGRGDPSDVMDALLAGSTTFPLYGSPASSASNATSSGGGGGTSNSGITFDNTGLTLPASAGASTLAPATASNFTVVVYMYALAVCNPTPCTASSATASSNALATLISSTLATSRRQLPLQSPAEEGGGGGSATAAARALDPSTITSSTFSALGEVQGVPASAFTFLGVSNVLPTTVTRTKTYWQQWGAWFASIFTPGVIAGIALACIVTLLVCTAILWCRWRARRRAAAKVQPLRRKVAVKEEEGEEEEQEQEEEEVEKEDSFEELEVDAYSVGKRRLQTSLRKRQEDEDEDEVEDVKPLRIRAGKRLQGAYASPSPFSPSTSSSSSSREGTGDSYFSAKSPTDPKGGAIYDSKDEEEDGRHSVRTLIASPPRFPLVGHGAQRSASVPKRLTRARPVVFKGQAWDEDNSEVDGAKAAAILQRSQNLVAKSRNVALGHLSPVSTGGILRPRVALKSAGAATLIQQQQRRAPNLKGLNLGGEADNGDSSPFSPKPRSPKGVSPSPYGGAKRQ